MGAVRFGNVWYCKALAMFGVERFCTGKVVFCVVKQGFEMTLHC